MKTNNTTIEAALGGEFVFTGSSLTVHRTGYGATQLSGPDIFGSPKDPEAAVAVLHEAIAVGVNHIGTNDFMVRKEHGKHAAPTAAILDSWSVKSDGHGGDLSYAATKRIKGRKRKISWWTRRAAWGLSSERGLGIGTWWEISQKLAEKAGLKWRGRYE